MDQEDLKKKIGDALREACLPDTEPLIELEASNVNRIGGRVLADRFATMSQTARQSLIWSFLDNALTPDEAARISFIATDTRQEHVAAWLWDPTVRRLRSIELPPNLSGRPSRRAHLVLADPNVAPGDAAVREMPQGWFLADTIQIAREVAGAFALRAIDVSNLAQTTPGRTVPAMACSPEAPLRLLDWCSPELPIVMKIINLSSKPAAFRGVLVGDQVETSRSTTRRMR